MLIFCIILTLVNSFWLIKKGIRISIWKTQPVLFPFFQWWGHIFPTEIKLSPLSEVSNDHFEFCDASTQGYEEVSQKFTSIRRVRGDNYCALRATLFQAMSQPAALPSWLEDPELTLVRCCCRFESAMFPVVSERKTVLAHACAAAVCRVTSACGCVRFCVTRWFCIVKQPQMVGISQKRKVVKYICYCSWIREQVFRVCTGHWGQNALNVGLSTRWACMYFTWEPAERFLKAHLSASGSSSRNQPICIALEGLAYWAAAQQH